MIEDNLPPAPPSNEADIRAAALADWKRLHDPGTLKDANAVIEAGHIAHIILIDGRRAFDPKSFGDLVDFIEEMPF